MVTTIRGSAITVDANQRASSAVPDVHYSVRPDAQTSDRFLIPPSKVWRTIIGFLPGGRRLSNPLNITIKYGDGEVLVSEPRFYMHASASTEAEAVSAFRHIFSGYLDFLAARENRLDPYLSEQLAYLRSYITEE